MASKRRRNRVHISAVTWNMGNHGASKKVIADLLPQLMPSKATKPDVIIVATQEEMASTGQRLQDLLLEALNRNLSPNEQYELIQTKEPQFHTTMAGANQKVVTLVQSLFTSDNRVSSAILVKKPWSIKDAVAQIDYEQGKEKGNKSVITIKGELVLDKSAFNLSVSGGHWDSHSDIKRREHGIKFLTNIGVKSFTLKTFDEIYHAASSLILLLGDFNERDYLMKSGTVNDEMRRTIYPSYGFDVALQPQQLLEGRTLHGTYGYKFENDDSQNTQVTTMPDTRKREHVATGGYLDRVAYSSGLSVLTKSYGAKLDQNFFKLNSNGKWCYHHSDHTPVIRNFEVEMPTLDEKEKIVGNYIKRYLPDFSDDCAKIFFLLHETANLDELMKRSTDLLYHDSTVNALEFLKQLANVEKDDFVSIQKGLEKKHDQKEKLLLLVTSLENTIDEAVKAKDTQLLEKIFNTITKCNELGNVVLEVMNLNDALFPESKKMQFMGIADEFMDLSYLQALNELMGIDKDLSQELNEIQNKMDTFILENPVALSKFSKIKDENIISISKACTKLI